MKILLSTDGSNFSKAAIDFCPNIVTDLKNTSLKIISVIGHPMPIAGEPIAISAKYYNDMEQFLREQCGKFIEQTKTQVRSLFWGGLLDLTAEVITDSPQRVIVETAREWGTDLIVIGSHGMGFGRGRRSVRFQMWSSITRRVRCWWLEQTRKPSKLTNHIKKNEG